MRCTHNRPWTLKIGAYSPALVKMRVVDIENRRSSKMEIPASQSESSAAGRGNRGQGNISIQHGKRTERIFAGGRSPVGKIGDLLVYTGGWVMARSAGRNSAKKKKKKKKKKRHLAKVTPKSTAIRPIGPGSKKIPTSGTAPRQRQAF